ncbi:hypothetical protein PBY51_017704 [Eleginops maclovinus]|uniref:Extracellular matrix protein 1 n=1 Tax=Eleginops maclovinus TaxID=56733 RepID=A0AAN7XFI7_ELEMC|nr:hypothetical protein PBY51_017704 [Eleginops maclovinus]
MGSPATLACCTALVLVLLSSASKDGQDMGQHEVTFDIDEIMQEMIQPGRIVLQKQSELPHPDPKRFLGPRVLTPRGGRPSFRPRSPGGIPWMEYPVEFPLGRPTSDNIHAICINGDHRPRYPDSYFPTSGYGKLKRMASSVNKLENLFSSCCGSNHTWGTEVTLCCAFKAWGFAIHSYCEEDSSIKDLQSECCKQRGSDRLNCFHNEATNPNYTATQELPVPQIPSTEDFDFSPLDCSWTITSKYVVRGARGYSIHIKPPEKDFNFPPGRPSADNIESLCRDQKLRPLYKVNCLPNSGYELIARQAKTINRVEKGFKQCCKKKQGVLDCADQKWREELNRFCNKNGKQVDFECCLDNVEDRKYTCLKTLSPDPYYNLTSTAKELSLHNICDTHKIIKKKFPVGFPLNGFVKECCPLSEEEEKALCFVQELDSVSRLCSPGKAYPPSLRHCCSIDSHEQLECISKILVNAITKATKASSEKKKKRCPLF